MKTLATQYSFNTSTKQVVLTSYPAIDLNQLLLITNVSRNTIIYNFADPLAGGNIVGNILTLSADTSQMADTDSLQIFFDDLLSPASDNVLSVISSTVSAEISAARALPVFVDFDSVTRTGGHYPVGGRFVDATSFSPVTSVSAVPALTGFDAVMNFDIQTGGAVALQGDLDKDIDSVTTFDVGYASVSNFLSGETLGTVASGTGVQVLSANANRITLFGQNLGTQPLLVKYGLGCNSSSFNFILYPSNVSYDGRGEKFSDDRYKGDVSVNTTTGLSAQYIFWEGV